MVSVDYAQGASVPWGNDDSDAPRYAGDGGAWTAQGGGGSGDGKGKKKDKSDKSGKGKSKDRSDKGDRSDKSDKSDKGQGKSWKNDSRAERTKVTKTLDRVEHDAGFDEGRSAIQRRLEVAAESSGKLSAVWSPSVESLLRFRPGMRVADIDGASCPGFDGTKADAERFIELSAHQIAFYQELLYANGVDGGKRRMLVVLQGMDASGKGGIVRHVFHQGNPMGISYHGFGKPTEEELQHDYLWRIRRELPKNGWIKVFDRSHYEDIVMPHVYGTYPEDVWRARYDEINDFEASLLDDGCSIIKIFLVVSRECQKKHFLGRLDDPCKYWKFDPSDLDARARWDDYMDAWQEVFEKTSTRRAPWYLVPADHRWYSRAVVSELLRVGLRDMGLNWPPARFDMAEARRRLEEEDHVVIG
ncbi:polyphosphate--nucleotide phosphotransferase [Pseudoscardovia radai]|uniref:Polyphosphate--nucleotide phosphotransferase n=1 Tax=Pseudoscardovia radai TaxID=987066 RepID=A0A261EVX0_9BIFI|nr:PPK2 family polyphosphate kinase [Pseudoscardovia radai]OZG51030.1 polyphosphate--nucleotide phosphotransferase [Pseudoscardovia radai]